MASDMMGKMIAQNRAAAVTSTNFSKQLDGFAADTEKNLNEIAGILSALGKCWEGVSYDNFKDKINKELRAIREVVPAIRSEAENLREKAKYYDMIEQKLRKASEGN